MKKFFVIYLLILSIWIIGYVKCIVKFVKCDFEAPYKKEIIYGVGIFAFPIGGAIGWFNIEENDKN